jgi:hypothetical protein
MSVRRRLLVAFLALAAGLVAVAVALIFVHGVVH